MKNLLIILIIAISSLTSNAQGYIGYTATDVEQYGAENNLNIEHLVRKNKDGSKTNYIQGENEKITWFWFLNDADVVTLSMVTLKTNNMTAAFLNSFNEKVDEGAWIKMNPKLWLNYMDWGVVSVEFTPETDSHYASVTYTYELY